MLSQGIDSLFFEHSRLSSLRRIFEPRRAQISRCVVFDACTQGDVLHEREPQGLPLGLFYTDVPRETQQIARVTFGTFG